MCLGVSPYYVFDAAELEIRFSFSFSIGGFNGMGAIWLTFKFMDLIWWMLLFTGVSVN